MENWFYNYQTLLVGGFGFAGVMATLWINAWLQREQHERDLQKSRQERTEARAEAASALRSALYQELKILSATMQSSIGSTDKVEREGFKDTIFTLVPGNEVYKAYIGKIDLLTSYEIQRIVVAYLSRETYIERLTQISKHPDYSIPDASGFHFTPEAAPIVRSLTKQTIKKLDSARDALGKQIAALPDED